MATRNQSRPIGKRDRFLDGAIAEGFVAHNISARILQHGGGDNEDFGGARCALVHQHDQGQVGNRLSGIGT